MEELYRLAIHDAPYVVWSYVAVLVGLAAYIGSMILRMGKINKEIQVLQDAADKLPAAHVASSASNKKKEA